MLLETEIAQAEEETQAKRDYVLARDFVLRMTGFPVETLLSAASPELAQAADEALALRGSVLDAARTLLSSNANLSRNLRRRLKNLKGVPDGIQESSEEGALQGREKDQLQDYKTFLALEQQQGEKAAGLYEQELHRALKLLYEFVMSEPFQQILLLSSPELARFTPSDPNPPKVRNSHIRQREFTWISYLQRLATKNETISFFGPTAWGEIDPEEPSAAVIELADQKITDREVYVERWVAEILARLISSDPEAWPLLPVRLADDVVINGEEAVFLSTGKTVPLTLEESEMLKKYETVHHPGPGGATIDSLIEKKILLRNVQVPISPYPFESLRRQIAHWPDHPAKHRWSDRLQKIEDGRAAFESAHDLQERRAALQVITRSLVEAGADAQRESQALYASRLPINEDCRLGVNTLKLGQPMIEQMLEDTAPWYEFWRDLAGLYTTRLHQSLQQIWKSLGGQPVPLPVFLRTCANKGMSMTASGGTGVITGLEAEIQQAWRNQLGDRWTQPAVKLDANDLSFLRSNFSFRRMKAFDNMAPDVQIIARDAASLSDGNWSLLLAEIHPDFTKWQHCFFVWCPDKEGYARDYAHQGGHNPAVVVGTYPPFFTSAHIALCIFPYTRDWTFVGVPGPEGADQIRSAETLVTVTDDDVLLVHQGRVLGSLLNTWNTALNTHRLELRGGRDHSPRLYVGRVAVQRETWTLQPDEELRRAAAEGGYPAFSAFRKFRKQYGLPETAFVRGCMPQRLNFHKDVKPVFMDFQNPLLVEVLSKMTGRFRKLSISEMLPPMESCWLKGPDGGHYSCEFRTVVMATQESRNADPADHQAGESLPPADSERRPCLQV